MMIWQRTVFFEALSAGARGGIWRLVVPLPTCVSRSIRAVQSGQSERASALQEKLTRWRGRFTKDIWHWRLKAAMEMAGYVGGGVRSPLRRPDKVACAEIESLLRDATRVSGPGAVATGS